MPSTAIPIPPTAKSLSAFSLKLQSDRLLATTLMDLLQDMETGHRGFLLTREPRYLDPYNAARPRVEEVLRRLREVLSRDEAAASLDKISAKVAEKLQEMEGTLELARAGRYD